MFAMQRYVILSFFAVELIYIAFNNIKDNQQAAMVGATSAVGVTALTLALVLLMIFIFLLVHKRKIAGTKLLFYQAQSSPFVQDLRLMAILCLSLGGKR